MQNDKVIIETSADLYKLPISLIQKTKLYNFKGKYFDKLYEEALKIERSGGTVEDLEKPRKITHIEFQMQFNTEFGQQLAIVGSTNELGNWEGKKAYIFF